jgi:hypothetical protein
MTQPLKMSPTVIANSQKGVAAKTLMDAKMAEFIGWAQAGSRSDMDRARAEIHEFMDMHLDAQAAMITEIKDSQ